MRRGRSDPSAATRDHHNSTHGPNLLLRPDSEEERVRPVASNVDPVRCRSLHEMPVTPTITYPAELPISERRAELLELIRDHQVVVVAGETGSGKSTQIPKLCLELGRGNGAFIGHTQPRRLAARAIAERLSDELGTSLGETVGYTVRFNDRVGDGTQVKVMTDGILLAEIPRDRNLSRYDTIIIDEAHERSLNIDFILGYLKQLLPRRPDLKVIITSATIDTARFSEHFDDAPVVEVSGRAYPVDVEYEPLDGPTVDEPRDQNDGIADAVRSLWRRTDGDILVFCSGEREIRDAVDTVGEMGLHGLEILPLYARLSAAEQHRVFANHDKRRVVIATNVAETSITVPGIRSVIDTGTARISRYSHRTKVQRLPIEAISQASADQRAGRCGRLGPGICIRLYSEDDYASRPEFTEPEIRRTNLASVILRMASLGLGDIDEFPFVDRPEPRAIRDGIDLLDELDALDPDPELVGTRKWLTPTGRDLARIPVDPRYGRMLLEADHNGCLDEVMVIVAGLSVQDPRERPSDRQQVADESHRRFADPDSDFLSYLNLWSYLRTARRDRTRNQFRRLCKREFLNYNRIVEWQDIHAQLRDVARDLKLRPSGHERADGRGARPKGNGDTSRGSRRRRTSRGRADDDSQATAATEVDPDRFGGADHRAKIHMSILSGLLSQIGNKVERDQKSTRGGSGSGGNRRRQRAEYDGARSARFAIAPGSAIGNQAPKWVMAAELVETNRLWARTVAGVHPDWIEDQGGHLARYSYGEPWWDAERGSASVTERVTLFGLTLAANRRVQLSRVNESLAREMFIQHALIEGDWNATHDFVAHNRAVRAEIAELEARSRRRDLVVEAAALFAFYDERIPANVVGAGHFNRWWKQQRRRNARVLDLSPEILLRAGDDGIDPDDFPESWIVDGIDLELAYEFDPASHLDGVSVIVPVEVLNQLSASPFTWTVPGLRAELIGALTKTLPKDARRSLTPINDTVDAVIAELDPDGSQSLPEALANRLGHRAGLVIRPDAFDLDRVPGYLMPTFRVVNENYELLAEGKDLADVRRRLDEDVRTTISAIAGRHDDWERDGLTRWDFGPLPRVVDIGPVKAYPSLVDNDATVSIRLHPSQAEQDEAMWLGVRRLLRLNMANPVRQLDGLLSDRTKLQLTSGIVQSRAEWYNDAIASALDEVIATNGGPPWTPDDFDQLVQTSRQELPTLLEQTAGAVTDLAAELAVIYDKLDHLTSESYRVSTDDVRAHLARLAYPGMMAGVGIPRHEDVIRYLQGIVRRLDGLTKNPTRDLESLAVCRRLDNDLAALIHTQGPSELAEEITWMLEELRVGLFAQGLGTAGKISEKRVRRALNELATR
ncbi:MAG: ATP-dependent RNA helicase HrpA [Actinomycetota bacterium]